MIAIAAAGLGWLRVAGRPALDWALFAGLFWMRPRRGMNSVGSSRPSCWRVVPSDGGESDRSQVLELFGKRWTSPSTPPGNRRKSDPDAAPSSPSPADPSRADPSPDDPLGLCPPRHLLLAAPARTGRSTLATELTCLIASSRSEEHPPPRVALVEAVVGDHYQKGEGHPEGHQDDVKEEREGHLLPGGQQLWGALDGWRP